ncbi:DNA cytosine methyltransferase [Streptomyces luteireticuli]|uniref:DNA (cytosine-5-)-methyltransferase n=1 Tax=Streptomyces luteireticuli TaxID=173858 RepID=A0ABN0Z8J3_9ACTN
MNECVWVPDPATPPAPDPGGERKPDAIRITATEAGILQSFLATYPWQGTKSRQFRQIGNAVPPLLAAQILTPHRGIRARQSGFGLTA